MSEDYLDYLKSMSEFERTSLLDEKISDEIASLIIDDENISSTIAETNAFDWEIDSYNIQSINLQEDHCVIEITFEVSGEQDENRPFCGTRILGSVEAIIDINGTMTFKCVETEISDF